MNKWQFTNYKGEYVTWYSADVIGRIRKEIEELFNQYANNKDEQLEPYLQGGVIVSRKLLDFLDEIDEVQE